MADGPSVYPSVYSYPTSGAAAPASWPKRIPVNNYLDMFRMTIVSTYELKKPGVLERYLERGFLYIRRRDSKPIRQIVRDPTVGCMVELTIQPVFESVPIQSAKGLALIKKVCYF